MRDRTCSPTHLCCTLQSKSTLGVKYLTTYLGLGLVLSSLLEFVHYSALSLVCCLRSECECSVATDHLSPQHQTGYKPGKALSIVTATDASLDGELSVVRMEALQAM